MSTETLVQHVLQMHAKYRFQNDADSIGEALREAADLLNIELTDPELEKATRQALVEVEAKALKEALEGVDDYAHDFVTLQIRQAGTIETLATEIGTINDDAHWDLVSEMKDALGADAANDGDDDDAETALESAEEWVTDNLSNGGIEADVAMALFLKGDAEGAAFLRENKLSTVERPLEG